MGTKQLAAVAILLALFQVSHFHVLDYNLFILLENLQKSCLMLLISTMALFVC